MKRYFLLILLLTLILLVGMPNVLAAPPCIQIGQATSSNGTTLPAGFFVNIACNSSGSWVIMVAPYVPDATDAAGAFTFVDGANDCALTCGSWFRTNTTAFGETGMSNPWISSAATQADITNGYANITLAPPPAAQYVVGATTATYNAMQQVVTWQYTTNRWMHWNYTGSPTVTTAATGGTYTFPTGQVAAGQTIYWRQNATGTGGGADNDAMPWDSFVVTRADPGVEVGGDAPGTVSSGAPFTVNCGHSASPDVMTITLTAPNGTVVDTGPSPSFSGTAMDGDPASEGDWICASSITENYTADSDTETLNVAAAGVPVWSARLQTTTLGSLSVSATWVDAITIWNHYYFKYTNSSGSQITSPTTTNDVTASSGVFTAFNSSIVVGDEICWKQNATGSGGSDNTMGFQCFNVTAATTGGTSCFPAGTKVLMADGNYENIEDLLIGDFVMSYDEVNREFVEGEVLELEAPVRDHMCEISFRDSSSIKVTNEHPFYVMNSWIKRLFGSEGEWRSISPMETLKENSNLNVKRLGVGNRILSVDGVKIIGGINCWDEEAQTYNLKDVGLYNNYVVEGMLVHNKGGGGGSSGMNYYLSSKEVREGRVLGEIREDDVIYFNVTTDSVVDELHKLVITDVSNDFIRVEIYSDEQRETLYVGTETRFDVTGDSAKDVKISLNSIVSRVASLTIQGLWQPEEEEVEEVVEVIDEVLEEKKSNWWKWVVSSVFLVAAGVIGWIYRSEIKAMFKSRRFYGARKKGLSEEGRIIRKTKKILRRGD